MNNRFGWFFIGLLVGVLSTMCAFYYFDIDLKGFGNSEVTSNSSGLNLASTETELGRTFKYIKILQTLDSTHALAYLTDKPNAIFNYDDLLVLIIGEGGTMFYDDMIINIENGQIIMQVGTFKYEPMDESVPFKTVPAVKVK